MLLRLVVRLGPSPVCWQKLAMARWPVLFPELNLIFTTRSFSSSSPASFTLLVSAESITYTNASVLVK